jgi:hypothetical protein
MPKTYVDIDDDIMSNLYVNFQSLIESSFRTSDPSDTKIIENLKNEITKRDEQLNLERNKNLKLIKQVELMKSDTKEEDATEEEIRIQNILQSDMSDPFLLNEKLEQIRITRKKYSELRAQEYEN